MALGGCFGGTSTVAGASVPTLAQAHASPLEVPARHRARPVLFVADVDSNVLLYPANIKEKDPPLSGEITQGVTRSVGVATDGEGTLYVVNNGASRPSLAEYKRGDTSPFRTITSGLNRPGFDIVDRQGTLYVADVGSNGGIVQVFDRGAVSPSKTIDIPSHGRSGVGGLAIDPNGNLLVNTLDVESGVATDYLVPHGSSSPQNLNLQDLPNGSALGVDAAGNTYAGGHAGEISVYASGSKSPTCFINANLDGFYTQMDVTPSGTIYWPNYDNSEMFEFAPGASAPTNVFATQGSGVDAAIGP